MTRNIYHKLIPSLKSLLLHNKDVKVFLFVEDDNIGRWLPEVVECVNVSGQTFFPRSGPNFLNPWTYMSMMRVTLSKLLPYDRILSLDCDTIIEGDISELWELELGSNYFGACEEVHRKFSLPHYYNAGVVMWNLEKMRDGKCDEIIDRLNHEAFRFIEQDCMNLLCDGHILELPSKYNVARFTKPTEEKLIYHFAACPSWFDAEPLVKKYKRMEWSEINGIA